MVMACLRHQHPEAYRDCEPPAEPSIPTGLRYGPGDHLPETPSIPEEPMGVGACAPADDTAWDAASWA